MESFKIIKILWLFLGSNFQYAYHYLTCLHAYSYSFEKHYPTLSQIYPHYTGILAESLGESEIQEFGERSQVAWKGWGGSLVQP